MISGWMISRAKKIGLDTMLTKEKAMNNLDNIFTAMRHGKYVFIRDTKSNGHIGLVNTIMREDGSGKNWIVSITKGTQTEKVFIHAQ